MEQWPTQFDFKRAVRHYGGELHEIVCDLIALMRPGKSSLPPKLYRRVLATLRPTEFAVRRLIAMAACVLDLTVPPVKPPRPAREVKRSEKPKSKPETTDSPVRKARFQLFDPFKSFGEPWLTEEEIERLYGRLPPLPRPERVERLDPIDTRRLWLRVEALVYAVEDIEGHALRLAKWRARQAAAKAAGIDLRRVHPCRTSPMRPGRPPGWKRKPKSEIESLLKDLHMFAHEVWDRPNTS